MDPVVIHRLADIAVTHEESPEEVTVAGAPSTGATSVIALENLGVEVGVWEMSVGAVRDVEAEEAFLVLAGKATIETDGGTHEIGAGDLVRLEAGTKTIWTVTEPLRKLYVTGA
ncbi:cupin domain-containing protein [Actinoplanes sp. NPDC051851]|uniref:cupin domain-containing protein n=1 Tax=Actinoplanes sp. NPDC051851 TaxID=3154753 RepID=UPI003423FDA9